MSAFAALRRVLRYAAPFRARFAVKLGLLITSILPLVLLPWPGKIVIDHVIESLPVEPAGYPFFVRPFLDALVDASPLAVLGWTVVLQLVLLALVGALGASAREQDTADAYLASGVRPFVELGFMPQALSSAPASVPYKHSWRPGFDYNLISGGWGYPPRDWQRWSGPQS